MTKRVWKDRNGTVYTELSRKVPPHNFRIPRVNGPIEYNWHEKSQRPAQYKRLLASVNPLIFTDPDSSDSRIFTWVTRSADAHAILLWVNGFFSSEHIEDSEMTRLEDSEIWTISLRLPASWRGSYRIGVWNKDGTPPWRTPPRHFPPHKAAMGYCSPDTRGSEIIFEGTPRASSIAAGPLALFDPWASELKNFILPQSFTPLSDRITTLNRRGENASGLKLWIYSPPQRTHAETPMLILFDGEQWLHGLDLPRLIDALIVGNYLPPLHIALCESPNCAARWENLGTPTGQIDELIDSMIPALWETPGVIKSASTTIVAGQSLGGLSALWALSLAGNQVGHAIAQSPSLWRFDLVEPLLANPQWKSVHIHSGTYEGTMADDARSFADRITADSRASERIVQVRTMSGGHDWACWRCSLIDSVREILAGENIPLLNSSAEK